MDPNNTYFACFSFVDSMAIQWLHANEVWVKDNALVYAYITLLPMNK